MRSETRKIRAADLSDWVRSLGLNVPNVQPNHSWRHRFKTLVRVVGISEEQAKPLRAVGHLQEGAVLLTMICVGKHNADLGSTQRQLLLPARTPFAPKLPMIDIPSL